MRNFWLRAAFASVLLAALSVRSLKISQGRLFPAFDEIAYLDLSREYAALGGAGAVVACHLQGRCREDNRHPLYALTLAAALREPPADFARAKLLSLALALILCGWIFLVTRAVWGEAAAWLCLAAAALAPATAQLSQTISADLAFTGFYFAAAAALAARSPKPTAWLGCGILAGLAYLTKGNGHVLLLVPLAVGLWRYRWRLVGRPEPLVALAGFAGAASFLLARNIGVWGKPFHNVNMRYLWLDSWRQAWFLPPASASNVHAAVDYWNHHSAADMLLRLLRGIAECARVLADAAAPGPDIPLWRHAAGAAILLLAARAMRRRWMKGEGAEVLAVLAPGLFLFAAFSWAAKAMGANERYEFPLAVSLWPLAASEALFLWGSRLRHLGAALACALALACAAFIGQSLPSVWRNPLELWAVPGYWEETSRWLCAHVGDAGFLISPESPYSTWDACRDRRRPYPVDVPPSQLAAHLEETGIRHVLLDRYAPSPYRFLPGEGKPDRHGPTELLGWPRCFHDSLEPSVFLVFSKNCAGKEG